jgi:hypothetical protein
MIGVKNRRENALHSLARVVQRPSSRASLVAIGERRALTVAGPGDRQP